MINNQLFCAPHTIVPRIAAPRRSPNDWIVRDGASFRLDETAGRLTNGIRADFTWYIRTKEYVAIRELDTYVFVTNQGRPYFLPYAVKDLVSFLQEGIGYQNQFRCSNCKSFSHHEDVVERMQGDCRRKSPSASTLVDYELKNALYRCCIDHIGNASGIPASLDGHEPSAHWPTVDGNDWCGDHSSIASPSGHLGALR